MTAELVGQPVWREPVGANHPPETLFAIEYIKAAAEALLRHYHRLHGGLRGGRHGIFERQQRPLSPVILVQTGERC